MIEIVSATRKSENDFWTESVLGRSLSRFDVSWFTVSIAFQNKRGLPEIYNERILSPDPATHLVFVHDDVWIDDTFVVDRVLEGCEAYDVIGIAGSKHRLPGQPSWVFSDLALTQNFDTSGSISHGPNPTGDISFFGPSKAACELLDGAFLATKKDTLRTNSLLFDPIFDFHFYDLDFCRSARSKNLTLGTWPICITHQSTGGFGKAPWQEKYSEYLKKWESPLTAPTATP